MHRNNNDDIRNMLQKIEEFSDRSSKSIITESVDQNMDDNDDSIPYTKQDPLYQQSLDPCSEFGKFDGIKNPLMYHPNDNSITLRGKINGIENGNFKFKYNDTVGTGVYVWADFIPLNDDMLQRLQKMYTTYCNWRDTLDKSNDSNKPMNYRNDEDDNSNEDTQETENNEFHQGDDLD